MCGAYSFGYNTWSCLKIDRRRIEEFQTQPYIKLLKLNWTDKILMKKHTINQEQNKKRDIWNQIKQE